MSTFMANKANIERKWYILDAAGKPLGKTAVRAADLLRGKTKVTYTPNADCGDNVIIINAGQAVLTGKKMAKKFHRTHSGWIGGLKKTQYKVMMEEKADEAMMIAVKGMLPHNTQGANQLKRLRTYKGAEHKQAAQKPEVCEF